MEEVTLVAEAGRITGTRPAKRLRRTGKIPAVLYGHGIDPVSVAVDGRSLRAALTTEAGVNALITLDVGGTRHLAMARQLQRDPVRHTVTHVDFVVVRRDEVVAAEVPLTLVGEAIEVKRSDGVLSQELNNLTVHATPGNIPAGIDVDVSGLRVGESIRVGDLKLPSGVSTDLDPELPVVSATASTLEAELPEAEETPEAAAAAAGEAGAETGAPGEAETAARDTATAEAEAGGDVSAGGESAG